MLWFFRSTRPTVALLLSIVLCLFIGRDLRAASHAGDEIAKPRVGALVEKPLPIVTGTVTDAETSDPLPGVNVVVKNTTIGTSTNREGRFELDAPSLQDTLVVSFVGYRTEEVPLRGRTDVDIALESEALVGEGVVVTALNIERAEEEVGYATQQIEGESLIQVEQPNVINNLNGKVAGLTVFNNTDFFGDSAIELRGEDPLIVIDGIPNENANLWALDATNIKSVDVLKGPSASALYGSLGRNGAILITTKRGEGDGLRVEVNSSTTFQLDFLRVPEKQTQYGSGRNGEYRYIDGSGNGIEGFGFTWGPKLDQPDPNTESGFVEIAQYNSPVDPETGERIPIPWISRGENNIDNFYRTGIVNNNDVAVSSSTENRSVRLAVSNKLQRGIVPNTTLQANTINLSGNYTYSDLTVDASINYNRQESDNVPEVESSSESLFYNITQWMGANIDVRDLQDYWVDGRVGFQQRHYSRAFYNNPYFVANEYNRGFYRDVTNVQLSATYDVLSTLSIVARSGVNYFSENRTEEEPKSFVRSFQVQQGNYRDNTRNNFNTTTDLVVNYERSVTDNLFLTARVGGSSYYFRDRNSFVGTDGLVVPNLYNISNTLNALNGSNFFTEYKKNSAFGILNLNWGGYLYLEATGRNDWVSTLPVDNNSFFYPSVSGSFVVSEVVPMPDLISQARVRASWAQVSNADLGSNYRHIPTYESGINWQNNSSLRFPGTLISPDLEPETSSSYEAGFELRLFDDRLRFDATYFSEREFNNIVQVPVSDGSGFSSRLENANEYEKRGLEFVLRATPIAYDNLNWRFTFNAGRSATYITQIDNGDRLGFLEEGDRLDTIYRNVWLKSPDGQFVHDENGSRIRDPFQRNIGTANPDWTLGLQNNVTYRNFTLSVGIDGRLGGLLRSKTIREMYWSGTHPDLVGEDRFNSTQGESTYEAPGVVVTGGEVEYDEDGNIISDTRTFAPNDNPVSYEDYFVNVFSRSYGNVFFDESFVKLREVSLGYQLPDSFINQSLLEDASVSLVGRNLLMLSDIRFLDPDVGDDRNQSPSMRSVGVNIRAQF
jgi:TonB-linked SusC/RagA family outer membrane protein